eukprot:scaffold85289_cov59-Attheya_sp.AAC.3
MQISLHIDSIVQILVHGGVSQEGMNCHQKATGKDSPPKDTLKEPKQENDRKDTHTSGRWPLRNLNG